MKAVLYHHRTRAAGAEGVHVKGIQDAIAKRNLLIHDISLYTHSSEAGAADGSHPQKRLKIDFIYNFIASNIPNILFKVFEILYNLKCYYTADKTVRQLLNQGIDVEFIYERYAYFCFALSLISKKYKIPVILEVNTTSYTHDVRSLKLKRIARKLEKYIFRNADLIVVVSEYLKKNIVSKHGIDSERVIVTPNAVNKTDFVINKPIQGSKKLQNARDFSKNSIVIGFVGVFVPWHGLDFLIDLFLKLLNEKNSRLSLKLMLVGDGPTKEQILLLLEQLKLTESVFFTGMIPHAEVKNYIDLFDIAIMPDSNPFGSPMKIFEYMAMGKTVVAPDYEPISDVITHEYNGMLFKKKNSEDCLKVMNRLILSKDLRTKIGKNARQDVFEQHTWDKNVDIILNKYQNIMNK